MSLLSVDANDPGGTRVMGDRFVDAEELPAGWAYPSRLYNPNLPSGSVPRQGSSCDDGIPARHPTQDDQFDAISRRMESPKMVVGCGDFKRRRDAAVDGHASRVLAEGQTWPQIKATEAVNTKAAEHAKAMAPFREAYERKIGIAWDDMNLSQRCAFGAFYSSLVGKNSGGWGKKRVRCVETGEVFPSAQAAARTIGMSKSSVRTAILDGIGCGGFTFAYADEPPRQAKSKRRLRIGVVNVETGEWHPSLVDAARAAGVSDVTVARRMARGHGFRLMDSHEYLAARKGAH